MVTSKTEIESERSTADPPPAAAPHGTRAARLRDATRLLARVVLGAMVGYAIGAAGIARLPDHLDVRTDIIGYPIFSGFDAPTSRTRT